MVCMCSFSLWYLSGTLLLGTKCPAEHRSAVGVNQRERFLSCAVMHFTLESYLQAFISFTFRLPTIYSSSVASLPLEGLH